MTQNMERKKIYGNLIKLSNSGYLKEYLHGLNDSDLNSIEFALITMSDNTNDYKKIVETVSKERQKRVLSNYLDEDTSSFICNEYSELASQIRTNSLKESIEYFVNHDINYQLLIKWCPSMMDIFQVYSIYRFLVQQGFTDEGIIRIISSSSDKLKYFDQLIRQSDYSKEEIVKDEKFSKFIAYSEKKVHETKAGTESYRKIINYEIAQNKEVLEKLK